MITFVKGIYADQINRVCKMLEKLKTFPINPELDESFFGKTLKLLEELHEDIDEVISSGDLDIEELSSLHIIRYNTFHERLIEIELFRYLVIKNFDGPEIYFKHKIARIYKEINCFQRPPIITTISDSETYYWALPAYDIIAVPTGEEQNLLNLPDLYHEIGHLIFNEYEKYLKGDIETVINLYYQAEIRSVGQEQRDPGLIPFYKDKTSRWINSWIMEFICDFIATYLTGPAYAWTNLKIATLSSGKEQVYAESQSHPSDESRMRGIFYMLKLQGYQDDVIAIEKSWKLFLDFTDNPVPNNYAFIFPEPILESLAKNVIACCKATGLRSYEEQKAVYAAPISKILNEAWREAVTNPANYKKWEEEKIQEIKNAI